MNHIKESCTRFELVLASRRTNQTLLELFDRVQPSTKFSAEAKPYCFALLLEECAKRLRSNLLHEFVQKIEQTNAAQAVRQGCEPAASDKAFCAVVARLVTESGLDGDRLCAVFEQIERLGLSAGRGFTIGYLLEAELAEEVIDAICDITHEHGQYA